MFARVKGIEYPIGNYILSQSFDLRFSTLEISMPVLVPIEEVIEIENKFYTILAMNYNNITDYLYTLGTDQYYPLLKQKYGPYQDESSFEDLCNYVGITVQSSKPTGKTYWIIPQYKLLSFIDYTIDRINSQDGGFVYTFLLNGNLLLVDTTAQLKTEPTEIIGNITDLKCNNEASLQTPDRLDFYSQGIKSFYEDSLNLSDSSQSSTPYNSVGSIRTPSFIEETYLNPFLVAKNKALLSFNSTTTYRVQNVSSIQPVRLGDHVKLRDSSIPSGLIYSISITGYGETPSTTIEVISPNYFQLG